MLPQEVNTQLVSVQLNLPFRLLSLPPFQSGQHLYLVSVVCPAAPVTSEQSVHGAFGVWWFSFLFLNTKTCS